jgi:hypothetical protein
MNLELPDTLLDALTDRIADAVAARLDDEGRGAGGSPWKRMEEAAEYTRIPLGTFKKLAASGHFPSHGDRRKVFHVAELDRALGYIPQQERLRAVGGS